MDLSLEERKLRYIEMVNAEHVPPEQSWWEHPGPLYYLTKDYAANHNTLPVSTDEPGIFKKLVKEKVVVAILFVVAFLLLFLLRENEFKLMNVFFLLVLLVVILPKLLNNKTVMNISKEGIWLYKEDKNIHWENILLTYIKEVRGENTSYSFVVHYYNKSLDEFQTSEIELDGLVSPALLSATVEAYKNA